MFGHRFVIVGLWFSARYNRLHLSRYYDNYWSGRFVKFRTPLLFGIVMVTFAAGCSRGPSTPSATSNEETASGPAWFEDVTEKVGLKFTHDCGSAGSPYFMPRVIGSGAAAFDFDGDGRLDIYLIQNGGPKGPKNQLFHQEPDGTFRDVSEGSGLDVAGYGQGVAVGDIDDDGLPDLLLTEFGATRLFLNLGGGKFREITREAGIDNPLWATSAAFFDFDRDGRLDFVVTNYLSYKGGVSCGAGAREDFCNPNSFPGTVTKLYRNLGKKANASCVQFEDVTLKAGLFAAAGRGLGVLCPTSTATVGRIFSSPMMRWRTIFGSIAATGHSRTRRGRAAWPSPARANLPATWESRGPTSTATACSTCLLRILPMRVTRCGDNRHVVSFKIGPSPRA